MTHKLDTDDFFIHRVQFHAARLRLSFFLVEPCWIESFSQKFAQGEVWTKVLLNMHSEHHNPADPFSRLIAMAASRKTQIIDPPETALAAFDKARFHPRILGTGVRAPFTVIVPKAAAGSFRLTDEQKQALGSPFVIKPSLGYGRKGVVIDATSEADLAKSTAEWPDSDYLLQRRMVPRMIADWPAYFRVYFAFGTVWRNWWNCFTDRSRPVTAEESSALGLEALESIARKLADVSGMRFFSTEILLNEEGEFVVIDYINDQCHMLSQSANPQIGVPDAVVEGIAQRLVEGAAELAKSG
ncbi:MAG: hypothetical protein HYR88_16770 [Verrucomicrobia bacterium]|nr:hypothetical protein [Verrucomicrobiota bacterium]MBI3869494.1 hypothetical protein [Verrucomicrobiota bacterium]